MTINIETPYPDSTFIELTDFFQQWDVKFKYIEPSYGSKTTDYELTPKGNQVLCLSIETLKELQYHLGLKDYQIRIY